MSDSTFPATFSYTVLDTIKQEISVTQVESECGYVLTYSLDVSSESFASLIEQNADPKR